MATLKLIIILLSTTLIIQGQENSIYKKNNQDLMPYGNYFKSWENKNPKIKKTYYVDNNNEKSSDSNPGTIELPFKTISKAASIVKAGEKIIIKEGVYRESVIIKNSGISPDEMIIIEGAENENIVLKGSFVLSDSAWQKSENWNFGEKNVWQYSFSGIEFMGYNPFGMMNILHDREWLQYRQNVNMWPHFKRRGMIFIDGTPVIQVEKTTDLKESGDTAKFWVEHNGMKIHLLLPENTEPSDFTIEATNKEQVLTAENYGTSYVKIKGLTLMHSGNGFPVPQRGLLSTNRGHHWIIEDCKIEWANSVGIDIGEEMWGSKTEEQVGSHIIRRCEIKNCGVSGLQGMGAVKCLIEDNLFDKIGWQDAELAFESGGIKLHQTKNTLIRRNIFRDITYAPGIWLDYLSNKNVRVTNNLFTNITTARGAIYVEVSHNKCRIDHNVFYNLNSQYWLSGDYGAGGSALYTDGSDSIYFDHNIAIKIENTGYGAYLNAERLVGGRGGITRYHSVTNNIFIECKKHSIEFANEFNYSNSNVFSKPSAGYIKIGNPTPSLFLNIEAVQKLYGWEKDGIVLKSHIKSDIIPETYKMSIEFPEDFTYNEAGPFSELNFTNISIDPRKK